MFSAIFIRRPRFALVVSLFILIGGILCINRLPIAEYPEIAPPTVMVFASYPGASAQVIADTVASPLEAEINGIEDMIYYSSESSNQGSYTLNLTFKSGADGDMALVNVNNAVKRAEHLLPSEVTKNGIIVVKRSSDLLGLVVLFSDNPDHSALYVNNYASIHLKDALARIDGVGQAIVFGEQTYSTRIWLDPYKMRAYNVSESDIMTAVSSQNVQAASGAIGTESSGKMLQFKVEAQGRLANPEEFGNIIVRSEAGGRQIRLSDVAKVELGAKTYNSMPRYDGGTAVPIAIFKQSDANALQVMKDTQKVLSELEKAFPKGMAWDYAYDTTTFIEVSIGEIITTLLMTFLLVVLITYLFLQDWRATIIPMVAIPVSLIGTFFFMYVLDMSINTLTMFALILVIGSVVDDAICVTENCMRLIDEEKLSPRDAAFKSMEQLTGALIATTLVVVAIYVPIMFYGGMVGTIYTQFSVTMCIALCLSTVVALTLSPAMCALVLRPAKEPKGIFKAINIGLDWTRNIYMLAGGLLARRILLCVILLGAVLFFNYSLFQRLPGEFLPLEDKGVVFAEFTLPAGASLPRTEAALSEANKIISEIPGVKHITLVPGRSMTSGESENLGMAIVMLNHWDERDESQYVSNIQREIMMRCAAMPDCKVQAFVPPALMGLGTTGGISFSLQATDGQTPFQIAETANMLNMKLMQSGKALYAFTSFDASTPMIYLDIGRQKAEAMGIPVNSIFNALQSQLGSVYINDFNMSGKSYQVKMQIDPSMRENLNIIDQLYVTSKSGAKVPMSNIAKLTWTVGPRQSERFNMFPSATINAQGVPSVSSGELMDLVEKMVREELPQGYQVAWVGMSYQEKENQGKIVVLLMISLLMAYLFLVAQYESWTMPISVMLSVATATLGAIIALTISSIPLNIYCQLGLLMLIGLTAKSAILMVEFSKQERENGVSVYDAAMNGMKVRFRAVMMTALSFVIGVAPLVYASGAGAGSRRAIGVTTFWGMLVATVFGMMMIPGLYVIFQRLAEVTSKVFHKKK
jgi:hydrophobe/amphiphile efflux-1 (HAE1) family protein